MTQKVLLIFAGQLLLAGLVLAQQRGSGRKSDDGVELPREMERRPLQIELPLIGEALGRIPDRVTDRVYNSEKSKADLEKRLKIKTARLEWFGSGMAGSDLTLMSLTDGRVTLISLVYGDMPDRRFQQVTREIEQFQARQVEQKFKASGGVPIACELVRRGKTGAQFIAGVTASNWYLLTHSVRPEIAEGIRKGEAVVGMTEQELRMVMGTEPKSVQTANATKQLAWDPPRHVEVMGVEEEFDPLAGFVKGMPSGKKLTAEIRNGVVVKLQEPAPAGQ